MPRGRNTAWPRTSGWSSSATPSSAPWSAKCSSSNIPEFLEGELTRLKSIVVSRLTCAKISEALGMQEFLILGKGMTTHPSVPSSLLADVFESLLAAIYLDGGDAAARQFIIDDDGAGNRTGRRRRRPAATTSRCLQQLAQREHGTTPTYQLLDEKGPDHSKCFKVAAQVGADRYQPAWGRNKKEAEQRAARNALEPIERPDAAVFGRVTPMQEATQVRSSQLSAFSGQLLSVNSSSWLSAES